MLQVPLGQREKIGIFGNDYDTADGTGIRDYVHVDDLAEAHVLALEAVEPGKGRIYNIGTGEGNSVLEVIKAAEEVTGIEIATERLDRRAGDTSRLVADSARLRRELGWETQYNTLKDIISSAWGWHKRHPKGYGE